MRPTSISSHTPQSYRYVGPNEILEQTDLSIGGEKIATADDIKAWIQAHQEELINGFITATFVISEQQEFLISSRHTEHVMCAKGQSVLSAGEVVFEMEGKDVLIQEISNQSTGYCPQPASWAMVDIVLQKIGIAYPDSFSRAYGFRLCANCKNINLVKDEVFECAVCGADLSLDWNFE